MTQSSIHHTVLDVSTRFRWLHNPLSIPSRRFTMLHFSTKSTHMHFKIFIIFIHPHPWSTSYSILCALQMCNITLHYIFLSNGVSSLETSLLGALKISQSLNCLKNQTCVWDMIVLPSRNVMCCDKCLARIFFLNLSFNVLFLICSA